MNIANLHRYTEYAELVYAFSVCLYITFTILLKFHYLDCKPGWLEVRFMKHKFIAGNKKNHPDRP